jgi:repressor LexA
MYTKNVTKALPKLHPTQKKLLDLLSKYSDNPLTMMALKELVGASSTSVVHHHILQLEKKGYLRRNPSNPKDYRILTDSPDKYVAYINLYGLAQCGPNGSILEGDPVDRIKIESRLLGFPSEEAFMVQARGDSMAPHIKSGDFVIAQATRDHSQLNGRPVICVNNGEALIKKMTINDRKIILSSYNAHYEPFSAATDFRVEGAVRGVFSRSF